MTEEERKQEERREEGIEEPIEDLEAPAAAQSDVAGGQACVSPSDAFRPARLDEAGGVVPGLTLVAGEQGLARCTI